MSYSPAKLVKIKEDCQNADVFFFSLRPWPLRNFRHLSWYDFNGFGWDRF